MSVSIKALLGLIVLVSILPMTASAAGDPVRGKQLAVQCFACHGVDGNSPSPVNPRIGGQHEEYLLLALKAYVDGKRPNSLMSGAVLDKSEQDLMDMAAYFASQSPAAAAPGDKAGSAKAGPASGGPPARPAPVGFDRGERDAEFTSMLARAMALDEPASLKDSLNDKICAFPNRGSGDTDGDGLADRYDAAPEDLDEFVVDANDDGRFEICNIYQLQAIVTLGTADGSSTGLSIEARRERSYQLANDLDAAGVAFEPIGNCGPTGNCMRALGQFGFSGVFDGRGYTISNLTIDAPERGGVGLFGVLAESGVVMNLRLENASVSGRAGVGSIVGSNFGTVYRCAAEGSVDGAMAIGGLVGGSGGLVYDSGFSGRVTAKQAVGGLVGDMTGGVYRGRAEGEISGSRGVGGLVGLNTFGSIRDSWSSMVVSGSNDIGGLVGVNTDAKVRNSYATGNVNGDSNNIGGLVGFNSQSTVRNSYAIGNVTGTDAVGGLVGRNNGYVGNSFATGDVAGDGQVSQVIGFLVEGDVVATFAAGSGAAMDISTQTGESTGWAPDALPATMPLTYFCDLNGNGFVDPDEYSAGNYVWEFGGDLDVPAIRCAAGGLAAQR
ncbi:MAG: c-type cytochrome [Gammaproteobacteria bacterium]